MEIIAQSKTVRISPRKLRDIAMEVKKMPITKAMESLELLRKKGGELILETLKAAVANGVNNFKMDKNSLHIKNVLIDEGFKMKRRDTSHGARFGGGTIQKRTSHIKVILEG